MCRSSHATRSPLRIALACLALLGLAASASAQQPATDKKGPQPAQIDRNGALILIRSALLALHHANVTGNYTVLRDLGAPGFQAANTAARLSEIFASHRAQNYDLSGVSALDPQLSILPQIEPNGMMRMAGVFPSAPLQISFELAFAPVENRWKLFGLSVNFKPSTPAPPMAAVEQQPAKDNAPVARPATTAPTPPRKAVTPPPR